MTDNNVLIPLVVAIGATRILHRTARQSTLRKLAKGDDKLAFAKHLEIHGKLGDLVEAAKQQGIPWKFKTRIYQHESKGKVAVFETVSAIRKARRYYSVREKGGTLQVLAVPATSDLVNLLTLLFMGATIGFLAGAPIPFLLATLFAVAIDLALRLPVREAAVRKELEQFLSKR